MKAIQYQQYGDPSVLELKDDVPVAELKDKSLRIRVEACEVTKGDCELRSFRFPVKWFALPLRLYFGFWKPRRQRRILGGYIAGTVDAIGDQVQDFAVGDRVFGSTGMTLGGYGEFVTLPHSATLVKTPENVSSEQAAACILGGLNALHFMTLAQLKPGQRLLINGAGGSIGLYALQIAKLKGAHVTCIDAAHKLPMLSQLGADMVLDYQNNPLDAQHPLWDCVFNMVAGLPMPGFLKHLTESGTYLSGNPTLADFRHARRLNHGNQQRAILKLAGETREELQQLADWLSDGTVQPVIDSMVADHDIRQAHERVETEQRLGAVILSRQTPLTKTDTD
ncbi:NAD(P)-dependent alcohol dehydrogenase [Reinekea blandensis]|nr:NAD(P)-dependent alcohol dehydrogenase [Reinekea blandensis]